jgi:hypothetical protein
MATGSDFPSRDRVIARRDLLEPLVEKPEGTLEARIASVIATAVTVTATATLRPIENIADRQPEVSEKIVANRRVAKDTHLKQRTGDMLKSRMTWQLPFWVMLVHFAMIHAIRREDKRPVEDSNSSSLSVSRSSTRKTSWSEFRRRRLHTSHLHY